MINVYCMVCDKEHSVSAENVFKDSLGYGMTCMVSDGTCDISEQDYVKVVSTDNGNI